MQQKRNLKRFKDSGLAGRGHLESVRGVQEAPTGQAWPLMRASKDKGTTVLQPQGTKFGHKLNEGRSRFFPRGSRKGGSPVNAFGFSPVRL